MRTAATLAPLLAIGLLATGPERPWIATFDEAPTGALPEGWKAEATAPNGPLATWQVIADPKAPTSPNALSLVKVNHTATGTYNLCWTDRARMKDGTVELSFKVVSGAEDQGGGPMWRVKDRDNYYTCRMNPLEDNFRLYVVQDGKRKQLATATTSIDTAKWHTIKVRHSGGDITCWLNGQELLKAQDKTLPDDGGVGVWTKADAATMFDNISVARDDAR
jgi:hypothetical protein